METCPAQEQFMDLKVTMDGDKGRARFGEWVEQVKDKEIETAQIY